MQDILFEKFTGKAGALGVITLNRPAVLNAINHSMINALHANLDQWQQDDSVKAVMIRSNYEKAFCAGGDIAYVYESRQKGYSAEDFFKDEYQLNQKIHEYPKPYIALLNGITMGGGVGISIHGSHRVATENFLFSMPETGIGFFPDVGASYFLSRLEYHMGIYLGLTSARLKKEEALSLGLINYLIPYEKYDTIKQAFLNTTLDFSSRKVVSDILSAFSEQPPHTGGELDHNFIQTHFSFDSVEEIFESLTRQNDHVSHEILDILKKKSPISLKVTHREISLGRNKTIDECMAMEFNIAKHFLQSHDFFEGIRAVIIDKDKSPYWKPASLQEVTDAMVDEFFE